MQDEIVCTNHVALLNIGLPKETLHDLSLETLGPYLRDTAYGFGRDAVQLLYELGILRELDLDAHEAEDAPEFPSPQMQCRDFKSERFYGSMARQAAPVLSPVGVLLTLILSRFNTARVIVPRIAKRNEVAAFKIGFVSLFHAASSFQKLVEDKREIPFLRTDAVERIGVVLDADSVRNVLENRRLRNNLVHYRVGKSVAQRLSSDLPLFGLIEAHTGESFAAAANDVELGLGRVSDGLRALLPKMPDARETP